jgi:hypothetical protein
MRFLTDLNRWQCEGLEETPRLRGSVGTPSITAFCGRGYFSVREKFPGNTLKQISEFAPVMQLSLKALYLHARVPVYPSPGPSGKKFHSSG